jgi:hypothetical protein
MGTIWLKDIKGGLDTRRMSETLSGGSAIRAQDGHVNRGGEFEQRAAFVKAYDLPAGMTVGLANNVSGLFVFGSVFEGSIAVPKGVTYQRLQHPDGVTAIFRILSFDLFATKIYVVAEFTDGMVYHFYDGVRVTDWQDGRARLSFQVTGGAVSSQLVDLTVNGVSIILAPINWTTDNATTAAAIAAAINNYASRPDFTATVVGDKINLLAVDPGVTSNGFPVVFTLLNGFSVSPNGGVLADGLAPGVVFQSGTFAKTIGSKVYVTSGPDLNFSGVLIPTGFQTTNVGAGFIDMSTQAAGSEALQAAAEYRTFIAIFAERTTQIWYFDPNPALNAKQQVLKNIGTLSPRSVVQFGDSDLFFLDESGVRSLQARYASTAAATTDIGVAVDTLIVGKLRPLTTLQRSKLVGLIEPTDGRFWLVFPDEIFVFSQFIGSKISAWSTYTPSVNNVAFNVDEAIVFKKKVYLRSGDKIYVYGGLGSSLTYDSTSPQLWLPYLDAETPTKDKNFKTIDVACEGEWTVTAGLDPTNINASDKIATVRATTYNGEGIPFEAKSTHVSLRFQGVGIGPRKIGAAAINYEGGLPE